MAKYLITGIAGFIGSSIARALLAQGDEVRGIDNLSTGNRGNIAEISSRIDFREAKVKRVIYAASSSAYGDTPTLPKREDMSPNPISPYAVAKLASEYYMTS